jgi:ElaB/YqjD/DUF883 family membrane-anchored ribosome-binding protein
MNEKSRIESEKNEIQKLLTDLIDLIELKDELLQAIASKSSYTKHSLSQKRLVNLQKADFNQNTTDKRNLIITSNQMSSCSTSAIKTRLSVKKANQQLTDNSNYQNNQPSIESKNKNKKIIFNRSSNGRFQSICKTNNSVIDSKSNFSSKNSHTIKEKKHKIVQNISAETGQHVEGPSKRTRNSNNRTTIIPENGAANTQLKKKAVTDEIITIKTNSSKGRTVPLKSNLNANTLSRRTRLFKACMPAPEKIEYTTSTICTTELVYHRGILMKVGDIVALYDVNENDKSIYFAQVRAFLSDQFGNKSAVITWLVPNPNANYKEIDSLDQFDPSKFVTGPAEEYPRPLECMEFVCRLPSFPSNLKNPLGLFKSNYQYQSDFLSHKFALEDLSKSKVKLICKKNIVNGHSQIHEIKL